jgi:hypothetical protein
MTVFFGSLRFMAKFANGGVENVMAELRSKHRYETDLYWSHQLFLENWDSGPPHIMEEEP